MSAPLADSLKPLLEAGQLDRAFDLLYRAHAEEMARFVRSRDRAASVDDVCQETWSAVRAALPSFRFEASPRVWLFSIADRKRIDAVRKRVRGDTPGPEPLDVSRLDLRRSRRQPSPESALVREQRAAALRTVLLRFSDTDRELLELYYLSDLKPAEIVSVLALPDRPNTISQRIVRLTRRLKAELVKADEFASHR